MNDERLLSLPRAEQAKGGPRNTQVDSLLLSPSHRSQSLSRVAATQERVGIDVSCIHLLAPDGGAGTIYRYFDSKKGLITQLYPEIKREMGKAILEGYSEDLSLRERFQTLWLNLLDYYMDHRQELAFMEQFDNSPYMNAEVQVAFAEQYEPLMRFFRVGFQESVFKEMPLAMLSAFTAEVAVSLAKHHASGDLTLDDEAKELAMSATLTEK